MKSEENIRANLTAAASKQWLGIRLQLLGALFVGYTAFTTIITSSHATAPELAGLVISYALSITALLSGVLNAVIETEQEFIAVERVHGYSELAAEVNAKGADRVLPFGWPCQGVVKFDNVSLKYRYGNCQLLAFLQCLPWISPLPIHCSVHTTGPIYSQR